MDIRKALEHHQAGRLAEAIELYQQVLEQDPDNADALHLLGNAACQLGDSELAVSLIFRAHELFPDNLGYLNSLGMAFRAQGQFEQSLACYVKAREMAPEAASVLFGMANTQQAMGDVDAAEANFKGALAITPDFFEARYNLANLQKSQGRLDDAIDSYRQAILLQPAFADAHHNLGSAYQDKGALDLALESYGRALEGELPETRHNMGTIYQLQGQVGLAAESFENAIRLQPDFLPAYMALGRLLMEHDQLTDANSCFELAETIAPGNAEVMFNRGVIQTRLQQLDQARAHFERALQQRPGYVDALYNLGVVLGRQGSLSDAEACYRDVLSLDAGHVSAQINLSELLLEAGRSAEALQLRRAAYSRQNLFQRYSRQAGRTVLILFDAGKGNLNLTHLISERTNNLIDWMVEYADEAQMAQLPAYDLVFNAMGDPDVTGPVEVPLQRFLAQNERPLLNPPDKVALTARHRLPALLEGIDNILVPEVQRLASPETWDAVRIDGLSLLARPVDTHGGVGLERLSTAEDVAAFQARQSGPVYVSPFIDYRSEDGGFRKYRMIFVDRKPYPYHLAISDDWLVHYYRADMVSAQGKLDEERAFLENPQAALGEAGFRAIQEIGERLDLDYGGIDFSLMPDGRILVFEANATMLVHPEVVDGPLAHKNPYVRRIFDAFENLLERTVTR